MWKYLFLLCYLPYYSYAYMGAVMGKLTVCDDAKTGLEIDWNPKDFSTFTCPGPRFIVDKTVEHTHFDLKSVNESFNPRTDQVSHVCIQSKIEYKDTPPIRGNHRPNWAKYGEYLYVPPQRWLHNLEHGSIILLYHPCVDLDELDKLRKIVTGCLSRHVVTPYDKLTTTRPLALVAWGAKIEMNSVNEEHSLTFIKEHAHVAPEDIARNGLYDQFLIKTAVNTGSDDNVCSNYKS